MPLSYFGVDPKLGFIRITCSGGITQLDELMNRIQTRIEKKIFQLNLNQLFYL